MGLVEYRDGDAERIYRALEEGTAWQSRAGGPEHTHPEFTGAYVQVHTLRNRLRAELGEEWGHAQVPVTLTDQDRQTVAAAATQAAEYDATMAEHFRDAGDSDRQRMLETMAADMRDLAQELSR